MVDPDPRVSGKGIQNLYKHGIETHIGVEEDLCKELNLPFIYRVLTKRPYTISWFRFSEQVDNVTVFDYWADPSTSIKDMMLSYSQTSAEADTIILPAHCCTHQNALNDVNSLPLHIKIVFLPDNFTESDIVGLYQPSNVSGWILASMTGSTEAAINDLPLTKVS